VNDIRAALLEALDLADELGAHAEQRLGFVLGVVAHRGGCEDLIERIAERPVETFEGLRAMPLDERKAAIRERLAHTPTVAGALLSWSLIGIGRDVSLSPRERAAAETPPPRRGRRR